MIALRDRWVVAIAAAASTATVIVFALLAGSGDNVLSFITQQTGRGIQIESPVAGLWLWQMVAGAPESFIYYDSAILTFQVAGPGVDAVAAAMTPLLAAVVLAVSLLGIRAARSAARAGMNETQVLATLSLALVLVLIVLNKVGSPQFTTWLAVPVVLGLLSEGATRFRLPAALSLCIAVLTQLVYPYFYDLLLVADPVLVAIVTARNVLLLTLMVWSIVELVRLGGRQTAGHLSASPPARSLNPTTFPDQLKAKESA